MDFLPQNSVINFRNIQLLADTNTQLILIIDTNACHLTVLAKGLTIPVCILHPLATEVVVVIKMHTCYLWALFITTIVVIYRNGGQALSTSTLGTLQHLDPEGIQPKTDGTAEIYAPFYLQYIGKK